MPKKQLILLQNPIDNAGGGYGKVKTVNKFLGKPVERPGRKAMGLTPGEGSPELCQPVAVCSGKSQRNRYSITAARSSKLPPSGNCFRAAFCFVRNDRVEKQENKQPKNLTKILVGVLAVLLVLVLGMGGYIYAEAQKAPPPEPQPIAENQAEYVKPETPVDRSKNITLPGWGGFTIPANKTTITEGFEFHNPEENYWYEDEVSINGKALEKLVVDSGEYTIIDHYLKLAKIGGTVTGVTSYDDSCFDVIKTDDGQYALGGIGHFEGEKTVTVTTDKGESVDLTLTCSDECYYISFGLYLTDGDELLYQSGLVAPGKYIQTMELNRSLSAGTYDAYVVCQPYLSDQATQTNRGVVKITLTVR